MARRGPENQPLLITRGVPGTHDVELGISLLTDLKKHLQQNIMIPRFDSSIDDRVSISH